MIRFLARKNEYRPIVQQENQAFPYLRHPDGDKEIYCVSPIHGRSFVVGRHDNGRYVVSKGNGLSYTDSCFLFTPETNEDAWGLLLRQDAIRDYTIGNEIRALGIKTNHMECVLELELPLTMPNGKIVKPVLLQYSVECPYRICDAPFMEKNLILSEVEKWESLNAKGYKEKYMIAADVMIHNLRIMHDNGILHNAIHNQNYTWALELLDFELSHTPNSPYTKEDYVRHVPKLMPREVIQTYEIINYIAGVLHEGIDYRRVDALFEEYEYDVNKMKITCR